MTRKGIPAGSKVTLAKLFIYKPFSFVVCTIMPFRTITLFYYLGLLCALTFGCRQETHVSQLNLPVFHYNQPTPISSLDPAFAKSQNNIWAVNHLYNQLVGLDDSLQIVPELATHWQILESGKVYRFHMRKNVLFHADSCFNPLSTRPLIAADVQFSFSRLLDKSLNAPGSWIFAGKVDTINPFRCMGDSIFEIHLLEPYAPLLHLLTNAYCSVYPQEAVQLYKQNFGKHPVGTNAFFLSKWLGKKGMFFTNFRDCFQPAPHLQGIRISFMEDRNTAYLEFAKKGIDFFSGISSGFAHEILQSDGTLKPYYSNQFNLLKGDFLNTEYIGIHYKQLPSHHPLRNKDFRKALNYAIDRQKLIQRLRYGLGTPANSGFIPKGLPAYDPTTITGYTFNPELAKSLLKQAQYNAADPTHHLILSTNKDYVDLMTFIAKQWEEIGVSVSIDLVETATLREKMRSGSVSLFRASWIADFPDEETFLTVFYGKNPAPPNYTRFNHPQYNALYEEAIKELNHTLRIKKYQQLDQILIEECPVIFLFYDQTAWFVQKHVLGLHSNPINELNLTPVGEQ